MSQALFKKANTKSAKQSWLPHQDNSYIQNKDGHYITLNLFLKKPLNLMVPYMFMKNPINMDCLSLIAK